MKKGGIIDMPITLQNTDREIRDVIITPDSVIFIELDGTHKLAARIVNERGARAAVRSLNGISEIKSQQQAKPATHQAAQPQKERGRPGRKPGSKNKPKEIPQQARTNEGAKDTAQPKIKETIMTPEGPEMIEAPATQPQAATGEQQPQVSEQQAA